MLYTKPEQRRSTLETMVTFYMKENLRSASIAHSKALHKTFTNTVLEDFCNCEMT